MKKYGIIYCDPPWRYGGGKGKNSSKWGNSLASYDCMKLRDLKALPVGHLADENAALFMWVTWPMLQEGIELMKAWGFEYKTCAFVWNKVYDSGKPYCGMGYWTRSGSEFCVLAFKGKMNRASTEIYQVVTAPVEGHSKKPAEVRNRIVGLMGDLPRIELFAREQTPGWDVWGNQVQSDIDFIV